MMFFDILQFGYFLVFGLLKISSGRTFVGETKSDTLVVIEFRKSPLSCQGINIDFYGTKGVNRKKEIMVFLNDSGKCFSNISADYGQRIFNVDINMPRRVIFALRNASFQDTGKYYAYKKSQTFGETILLVGDKILQTCTSKQVELDFVLPASAFKELVSVVFYSGKWLSPSTISICNPNASTCAPCRPWQICRINGSNVSITLNSVGFEDQGIYALTAVNSGILYKSAILNPTDNGMPGCLTTTEQSLIIKHEYFVGGGAVAGIVLVTLASRIICKSCYRRKPKSKGVAGRSLVYENVDIHYNHTTHSHDPGVSESITTERSVATPERNTQYSRRINSTNDDAYNATDVLHLSTVHISHDVSTSVACNRSASESHKPNVNKEETKVHDDERFPNITDLNSEATNGAEVDYISACWV